MFSKGSSKSGESASPPATTSGAETSSKKDSGVPSIISPDLRVVGDLHSNGDLQVDGVVEGDIISRMLTIGEKAQVSGSLSAETVRVYGTVKGEVKATTVLLAKTARVTGDIAHQSLAIEAGAFMEGQVKRLEAGKAAFEPKVAVMKPAASSGGSASSGAPQAASAIGGSAALKS